jgi:hypothetical protein
MKRKHGAARAVLVPKVVLVFGVVLVVTIFGLWFKQTEAFTLATTHQPERFTELHFADPAKLPSKVTPGRNYSGTFVIANNESSKQSYTYQVTVAYEDGIQVQQAVKVSLDSGERRKATFSYLAPQAKKPAVVTVTLLEKQQSIHFKVEA